MKTIILFSLIIIPSLTFATDFTKVMLEDVKLDYKKHEDSYQKKTIRGPASVSNDSNRLEDQMNQDKKIEKMNFKQIGPSRW